uniref:Uncharacterized protein n=1 Tax=Triticum urartu TaxID=4572 RepID=A0A8R7QX25_TRIUA
MGVIISWHGSRDRILEQTTDKINKSLKSPQRELFFKLWDVQFSFSCSTSCRLGSPGYSLYCSALVVLRYFLSMHVCLVTIISRICKDWRNNTVQLPLYGEVLTLSLGVAPFCTVFVILWAAYRHSSFAWIGQDILNWPSIFTLAAVYVQCKFSHHTSNVNQLIIDHIQFLALTRVSAG